ELHDRRLSDRGGPGEGSRCLPQRAGLGELVDRKRRWIRPGGRAIHRGRELRQAARNLARVLLPRRIPALDDRVLQREPETRRPQSPYVDEVQGIRSGVEPGRRRVADAGDRLLQQPADTLVHHFNQPQPLGERETYRDYEKTWIHHGCPPRRG